jgi:hypothetical protein
MRWYAAVLVTLAVAGVHAEIPHVDPGAPLTVAVYPHIIPRDGDAWVHVRVERDVRSRYLEIEWTSAEGSAGSHLITLAGDQAPLRHEYAIKRLDPGEYEITAIVTRADGSRVRRTARLIVAG